MEVSVSELAPKHSLLTVMKWRGLNNTRFRALKESAKANADLHVMYLPGFYVYVFDSGLAQYK